MKKTLFIIVNSVVGKQGNIGFRTGKIVQFLEPNTFKTVLICRNISANITFNGQVHSSKLLTIILRSLNGFRIYISNKLNHRKYDILLFDLYTISNLFLFHNPKNGDVVHVWDNLKLSINYLRKKGCYIISDVPIAPVSYAKKISNKINLYNPNIHDYIDRIERSTYTLSNQLIVPSNFVKEEVMKYNSNITIVPFGSDENEKISPQLIKKRIHESKIKFCIAGSISARKGINEILDVWTDPFFDKHELHICGRIFPKIASRIDKMQNDNIITPGFIDTSDYFLKMHIFLLPSWMEGSSKAIYEAMSAGLPCIVSTSSGPPFSNEKGGYIIEPGNTEKLLHYMKFLINNREILEKQSEKSYINSFSFTWRTYGEKIRNEYVNILSK